MHSINPVRGRNGALFALLRLGGAAVFLAYVVAVTLALKLEHMPLRSALPLLALPVGVVGLWEDIARRVSPGQRLLAAGFRLSRVTVLRR